MKLTFCGGTQSVTGANYLLEVGEVKIVVDCGLFQGSRFSEELNYQKFSYDPAEVDYVLITHSHADHVGRLPKLYRDGFRGKVLATEPARAIMDVAIPDTMDKTLEEARLMNHDPLFNEDDYAGIMGLVEGVRYLEKINLGDGVSVTFHECSHILGSAIIEILAKDKGEDKKIVFSGDVGNPPAPLLNPIDYVGEADYLILESAYGSRIHEDREERKNILENTILETIADKGVLMIPSFAIERTQELLLEIDSLIHAKKIPSVPIFVDSPLAIKMTRVYSEYSRYMNSETIKALDEHGGLFNFPWLRMTPTTQESKQINDVRPPKIIIAGSGMSQGGRILHHESRYLPGRDNTILFVGYQVANSLGRKILDGVKEVSIFGQPIQVNCRVRAIGAYSAHADQNGLVKFVQEANAGNRLKQIFLVQGELDSAQALAQRIEEELKLSVTIPSSEDKFEL